MFDLPEIFLPLMHRFFIRKDRFVYLDLFRLTSYYLSMNKEPNIYFVNCGHGPTRNLNDCAKLGFISAGQGKTFGKQIQRLSKGDIIAVYRSKVGFVGVARVISNSMEIDKAILNGKNVTKDIFSPETDMFRNSTNQLKEWLVAVNWITPVHLSETPKSGAFSNVKIRNVVSTLDNQNELKLNLEQHFNINFQDLLNESKLIKKAQREESFKKDEIKTITFPDDLESLTFPEGKEQYIIHKKKERNSTLIKLAKLKYFEINPRLSCQVCDFSFYEEYGELGLGYIEAHHIFPISELTEETESKIDDLVFVCSNCHKMLHRRRPWLTLETLNELIIKLKSK